MEKNLNYTEVQPQMFHYETWVGTADENILKDLLEKTIISSGFTVVNFSEHYFPVKGYTCIWLLAESHVALHTFPEKETSFVQVSSCNSEKLELFKQAPFLNTL